MPAWSAVIVCEDGPACRAPLLNPPESVLPLCVVALCAERRAGRETAWNWAHDLGRRVREAVGVCEVKLRADRHGRDRRRKAAAQTVWRLHWLTQRQVDVDRYSAGAAG